MNAPPPVPGTGPLLATGGSAQIYAWGDGYVLKLYLPGASPEAAAAEAARTNAARAAGACAPLAVETVTLVGRHGIVFERIAGPTMLDALMSRPGDVEAHAAQLAEVHVMLHRRPGAGLTPLAERLRARIEHRAPLSDVSRGRLLSLLDRLPAGDALCHGDLHPGNVILSADQPIAIDWYDAAAGAADADLARSLLLLRHVPLPGPDGPGIETLRTSFCDAYLRRYRSLRAVDDASLKAWTAVVAAARLSEARSAAEREALVAVASRALESA